MDRTLAARLKKRIPLYLLLVGLGAIGVRYAAKVPSDVDVRLVYGAARRGLVSARVTYRDAAGLPVATARFDYARHAPPAEELHRVRLPDGDYDAIIELRYAGDPPSPLAARARPATPGHRDVHLRRPLLVRGSAAVRIFVSGG